MSPRRKNEQPWREQHALDAPFNASHDDQILTLLDWCRLNRISERTGRRILAGPDGPKVTMLSPRRIGITVHANRAWQKSKERVRGGAA
jgi:hypothetical protein